MPRKKKQIGLTASYEVIGLMLDLASKEGLTASAWAAAEVESALMRPYVPLNSITRSWSRGERFQVSVRVSSAAMEGIKAAAEEEDKSVAAWALRAVLAAILAAHSDGRLGRPMAQPEAAAPKGSAFEATSGDSDPEIPRHVPNSSGSPFGGADNPLLGQG